MNTVAASATSHAALMDRIYRGQRHIYDATRKYYLFGRDRLIDGLDLVGGGAVLEVGCGTARNLVLIRRCWPQAQLFGLDISAAMLEIAEAKLGAGARLAEGDATGFDAAALFGRVGFDRVVISFTLSMIPDWRAALEHSATLLAPGGAVHIVDFGDMAGMPAPLRGIMNRWLAHFHVAPRLDLAEAASAIAARHGLALREQRGALGYYRLLTLTRATQRCG